MPPPRLITLPHWPQFPPEPDPIEIPLDEYHLRLARLRAAMAARGFSHLAVYGDREHSANLLYCAGFDPRFEEALLLIPRQGPPLLLTGNECAAYLPISPLHRAGELRSEIYQPCSLLDQPRASSRTLAQIFAAEGLSSAGVIGWKYYDTPDQSDLPAYLIDALRTATAHRVHDATDLFMHPAHGLRASCSAAEIALFERSNWKASEALRRVVFAAREGMSDFEMLSHAAYDGTPLSCHMTLKTGPRRTSLASPSGALLERGHPWSANIAYWGSNICRACWVAASPDDLPDHARDYAAAFAGPYFAAMAEWLDALRIGTPGGRLSEIIQSRLPFADYGIFLNEGHLIHYDEWLSSPIYAGSQIPIRSGMIFQTDVIPSSPRYFSTRMEDGLAIAGDDLRADLRAHYPAVMDRIDARRRFAIETLGLPLAPEHLPLSNTFGLIFPYLLSPNQVFSLA